MNLSIKLAMDASALAGQAGAVARSIEQQLSQVRGPELATDPEPLRVASEAARALAGQLDEAASAAEKARGGVSDAATASAKLGAAAQTASGGVTDAATAAQQLGAAAQTASGGVTDAATAAAKLAEEAKKAGEAAKDAGEKAKQAGKDAADGSKEAKEEVNGLSDAVSKGRGAMGVFSGASAMASGSLQGMAGGAVQAANGMRQLGASLNAAMKATIVLAVVAAFAELARAIADARARADELTRGIQFDNMRAGAEGAAEAFSRLCAEMERAAGLQRDLDDVAGSGRRLEQEKRLAELERDRNRELAAGGDADEVNRRYDEKRRKLDFSFQRENNAAEVSGLERDRSANAERRGAIEQELERLEDQWRAQAAKAMASTTAMSQTIWPQRKARYAEEAERWGGEASESAKRMEALRAELKSLGDKDKVFAEKIAVAKGRTGLIDINEASANLAAQIPEKRRDEPAGGKPEMSPAGGFGSMQMASDRLARIGGFVGGNYTRQNETRELIQVERDKLAVMKKVEENTRNRETGALA